MAAASNNNGRVDGSGSGRMTPADTSAAEDAARVAEVVEAMLYMTIFNPEGLSVQQRRAISRVIERPEEYLAATVRFLGGMRPITAEPIRRGQPEEAQAALGAAGQELPGSADGRRLEAREGERHREVVERLDDLERTQATLLAEQLSSLEREQANLRMLRTVLRAGLVALAAIGAAMLLFPRS